MINVGRSNERGRTQWDWLDSYHSFSFGEYHDPANLGFRSLRVINEDYVAPGGGFPRHPHRDMEIITYVLDGALEHRDSLGNGSTIRPGDGQRMSAGKGIMHSEFNSSRKDPVHLLQIWIHPAERGIQPGYEQKSFPPEEKRGKLRVIASPTGENGSVRIHQDASLYVANLAPGEQVEHPLLPNRHAWVQVARGEVKLSGQPLMQGDGAGVSDEPAVKLEAATDAEVLVFDLN